MRKRVIVFCLLAAFGMLAVKSIIVKSTRQDRVYRDWQTTDYDDRDRSQASPIEEVTPPPWLPTEQEETPVASEEVVDHEAPFHADGEMVLPEAPPSLPLENDVEEPLLGEAMASSVMVNEIMFHPESDSDQEILGHEYVELYNPTEEPIGLEGYRFTRGIDFTFPALTIAPKAYVVVAADEVAFREAYGKEAQSVVGPWLGKLSNSGEQLRLEDAEGRLVDKVDYTDQGDWATRVKSDNAGVSNRALWQGRRSFRGGGAGWLWECAADGEGSSLELINPRLSNNRGANWKSSERQGGTPGRPNSVGASQIAPLISKVAHHPPVPKPNQPVQIVATIEDELPESITAEVYWRPSSRGEAAFQAQPMQRSSKGRYVAMLPGFEDKTVIEFYIEATDGERRRTWPPPTNIGQASNALFQVDAEVNRTVMGFYRLVLTAQELDQFESMYSHSNAQVNATLIADDGSGPVIRYQCGMRVRGAGSRNNRPRPMRVNIPRDHPWDDRYRMNLNSVYPWLQFIGMKIFQASDLPAPETMAVQVRLNGENHSSNSRSDYGAFVHVQPLDGQFIKQYFPNDPGGNLYKKVRPDNSWQWYRGDVDDYQRDGWLKQTNSAAFDWDDLDRFLGVMNNAPHENNYLEQVAEVMDIDSWLRYLGVMALLNNNEGGIGNGIDDDYAMYRGIIDKRFKPLPHDLDTILGMGESSANPQHTLFDFAENGDRLGPLVPLFRHPEIRNRYFLQLSDLIQTSFEEKAFDALVDQNLRGWVSSSKIDRIKDFMALRRHFVAQEVRRALDEAPPKRPAPTAAFSWQSPMTGNVMIHEILASNGDAYQHRGGFPDLIELHNPTKESVSLGGMALTDDVAKPGQFIFPNDASIPAGGYALVYADNQSVDNEWHLGFGLKQEGETLTLFGKSDPSGKRPIHDQVSFGPQVTGLSIGRGGKGLGVWALTKPTLGRANESVPVAAPGTVRINEWLASPEARYETDFVELANPETIPISLAGTSLTSDSLNHPHQFVFPPLSYIAPKGFLLLKALGKKGDQRHPCDLTFRLPSHYGWLTLIGSNGTVIDKVHYWCQRPDISQGRVPDTSDGIGFLRVLSPGDSNSTRASTEGGDENQLQALMAGLRISEIMYHPSDPDLEFLELTNIGNEPLSLKGVRFTEGIECLLPDMTLTPEACAMVVANREAFSTKYPSLMIAAEYKGKLSNGGETVQLSVPDPGNLAIQRFAYDDKWIPSTDGGGHSLEAVSLQAPVHEWSKLTQWRASANRGGSPGSL